MPLPARPYVGYEDYSPEGRAAIGAFNSAGGASNLYPEKVGSKAAYEAAVLKAKQAAMATYLRQQMLKTVEGTLGYDGVPSGSITGIDPSLMYQYPPK